MTCIHSPHDEILARCLSVNATFTNLNDTLPSLSLIILRQWAALRNVWNEQPETISSVSSQLNRKLMNHSKQLIQRSKRERLHQKALIAGLSVLK